MIRFYNGKIARFSPELRITDEEVWVEGNRIIYVGPRKAGNTHFERQINLQGDLLLPGFKNAHTHTQMTFLRSMADDMELERWLQQLIWPAEAKLTEDAVYYLTKLGILEYLSSGITASFDMYNHTHTYLKANREAGFRTVVCSAMNDFDKDVTQIERDYNEACTDGSDLTSYILGIHAEYTTSVERMEYMASLAEKYKSPCFLHLCETQEEVEGCIARYGITPPQLIEKVGLFQYGGGGYHCCYMTEQDIDLFKRKGLYAVTCPASNLKLASGIAPIEKMRKSGVKIAIGTDSPASNNALDFFREMFLVTSLQKYLENNATALPVEEVLKMACVNGADAMGLKDCNDIAEGKKADLIRIDLSRPNMQPENNILSNIVYSGSKDNIKMTMVNGKILYENREFFLDESTDYIYKKANEFVRSIK